MGQQSKLVVPKHTIIQGPSICSSLPSLFTSRITLKQSGRALHVLIAVRSHASKPINGIVFKLDLPSQQLVTFVKDQTRSISYHPNGHPTLQGSTLYLLALTILARQTRYFLIKLRLAKCMEGQLQFQSMIYLVDPTAVNDDADAICLLPPNSPFHVSAHIVHAFT